MVEKKPKTPSVKAKSPPVTAKVAERVKTETLKDTFIGKELLQASVVQRELTKGLHDLNANLKTLDSTLNLIREHEFVEFHKSKWKIFAYQILLGILFAIGTVFGLAILSWMTYTFFKDSEILKGVVNNQLKMRQFDFKEIRDRAIEDVNSQNQ
jgi:hypothetical protein